MAWTQTDLDALRAAYAAGVLSVSVSGRTVTYASGEDLARRIREIEAEISPPATGSRPAVRSIRYGRVK